MNATRSNSSFSFFLFLLVIAFIQALYQCQDDGSFTDRVKEQDQIEKSNFHYLEKRATSPKNDQGFKAVGGQRERSHSPRPNLQNIMRQLGEVEVKPEASQMPRIQHVPAKQAPVKQGTPNSNHQSIMRQLEKVEIKPRTYHLPEVKHDPKKLRELDSRVANNGHLPSSKHEDWESRVKFPHQLPEGGRSSSGGETIHLVLDPGPFRKIEPLQAHIKGADGTIRRMKPPTDRPSSPTKSSSPKGEVQHEERKPSPVKTQPTSPPSRDNIVLKDKYYGPTHGLAEGGKDGSGGEFFSGKLIHGSNGTPQLVSTFARSSHGKIGQIVPPKDPSAGHPTGQQAGH